MPQPIKMLLTGAIAAVLLAQHTVAEDSAPDPDMVLATVNGTEITLGHVIVLRTGLPQEYNQFPNELLLRGILDQLINQTLLSQSVEEDPSRQSRLAIDNERRGILAAQVMRGLVSQDVDANALQALYDERYPADTNETEYRASHILVETEEAAAGLVTELEGGADFAALAKEHSIGPSSAVGGDLGWFGAGDMVSAFFDAVAALSPGDISPPVQTDFGWHVIRLAETRDKERPALDAVRAELEDELRNTAIEAHIANLREKADITQDELDGLDPSVITNTDLLEN